MVIKEHLDFSSICTSVELRHSLWSECEQLCGLQTVLLVYMSTVFNICMSKFHKMKSLSTLQSVQYCILNCLNHHHSTSASGSMDL